MQMRKQGPSLYPFTHLMLSFVMRRLQLHVGRDAAVATHFAPPPLEVGAGADGGGSGSPRHGGLQSQASASELPANAAELAALARELMFAQERAAAELEAAQVGKRRQRLCFGLLGSEGRYYVKCFWYLCLRCALQSASCVAALPHA